MIFHKMSRSLAFVFIVLSCMGSGSFAVESNVAYFVDGYHGGVYGHYPPDFTSFLVEQLRLHTDWKINLEIEPETWDVARVSDPEAYSALKELAEDQSESRRIEFVNPSYAQSYLFQCSGESVIRQFDYGLRKLREHFPNADFSTYSSEEPCFTSCLPSILKSFGCDYAVLKNPNTCWGGYTSAYGGELVNWIGPDGTSLLTVPRYESESLHRTTCWQTIAFGNSPEYIKACFAQGIDHPVGMCLQDAGWREGPWLERMKDHYTPSQYVTWTNYIRNITPARTDDDWQFSQEDVKPGLMWGAQVLQRIAQQSRSAEHRLLVAEKLAAMALVETGYPSNTKAFDEAWRNVLLSQHHDCWIVPYNGRPGNTWADQVGRWTNAANAISNLEIENSLEALLRGGESRGRHFVRVFNPTGAKLDVVTPVTIPHVKEASQVVSIDAEGRRFATQLVDSDKVGEGALLVRATVPPFGYATVELRRDGEGEETPVTARSFGDAVVMESDHYRIEFDPSQGGTIRSLVAKSLGDREFVDSAQDQRFNELRGHFYNQGGLRSSAVEPAEVRIIESGPLRARVEISGKIAGHPFLQRVTITQGSPVIDCAVNVDWQGHPAVGEFKEKEGWHNRRRAAYDDRYKLLVLFPTKLTGQRVVKDAPFDVCKSQLADTFYNAWDGIKHNVILDWVDTCDEAGEFGLSLFSDHTTSYTQGTDFPLGLVLQYAGKGLWGRDYRTDGPTSVRYAFMPHGGEWDEADVPLYSTSWQEPSVAAVTRGPRAALRSIVDLGDSNWQIPAIFERDGALYLRLFNSHGDDLPQQLKLGFQAKTIELVELDGRVIDELTPSSHNSGQPTIELRIPRLGIRTIRFRNIEK
jgi:alpha-mannosidase